MSPVVKVLQPSGLLDGTKATQVRQEIDGILTQGADIVLIDLKDVTFIDSSGLGALVSALKAVRSAGSKLFICSINAQVKMLFELTSMDRVFQIFPNQDEFKKKVMSAN
ncbi:MAG: STAS domain-containing protein [Oscillatoria sp. Prado101]|jgi:anti-anti-sigma factor|nr:STAS domain-containing protein [Oscillatoria sp. Prado101]